MVDEVRFKPSSFSTGGRWQYIFTTDEILFLSEISNSASEIMLVSLVAFTTEVFH